jgi:small subunit ribosomal protein S6
MARYELMVILESSVVDEEVPEAVEKLQNLITEQGGTDEDVEVQGRRRLAYPIRKQNDGTLVLSHFDMAPDKVPGLETGLRMEQQIVRNLLLRL